jgi:hypothetical protein
VIESLLISVVLGLSALKPDGVLNDVKISILPANLENCRQIESVADYTADTATIDFRIIIVLDDLSEKEIMNKGSIRYPESTYNYAREIGANYVYHSMPIISDLKTVPTELEHLRFIVMHGDDFIMLPPKLYKCENGK